MGETWRTLRGIVRSLRIYYSGSERRALMHALYGQFVKPGDLVFDVGAHVGDRIAVRCPNGGRTDWNITSSILGE